MALLTVPVIDLNPFLTGDSEDKLKVAGLVNRACEDIGFLVVTGHGVDARLCNGVFEESKRFFDLPVEEKLKVKQWGDDIPRGFSGIAAESVAYSRLKWTPGDLKESFSVGPLEVPADEYYKQPGAEILFAENRWPEGLARFRQLYGDYYRVMERLAENLLRIFALALDVPENYFDSKADKPFSVLRVINYPNQPEEPLAGQLRAGEHSDYTALTILRHEDEHRAGGLQVQNRAGDWVDVPKIPESLVINLGDMMQHWTNDRWVSTMHRVVNPPRERSLDSRRMSLVFFHEPNYDTVLECLPNCSGPDNPPKYPPVSCGEYLRLKFTRQTTFDRVAAAQ
ncbi:MAG: isopenicillin N synthase family dioxygenase [Candidatus Binataceae bacterium]